MRAARRLFPGPDETFGGIVVGEAYRVDQDRVARRAFDPADKTTWGQGGAAPLLIDPCRTGSTHALVFSGPGGFKTTAVGVPTMLTWTGAAVVLDPSREIGPMVQAFRQGTLGHRVVTLDPADPAAGAFNVLDWIDVAAPDAETNVEAVVNWICGEALGQITSGAEFFRESGKGLIACLLADTLWDKALPPERKTLRELCRVLVTPEPELRERLARVHATSTSPLARDLAGALKDLVADLLRHLRQRRQGHPLALHRRLCRSRLREQFPRQRPCGRTTHRLRAGAAEDPAGDPGPRPRHRRRPAQRRLRSGRRGARSHPLPAR
jgi:type IV secretion system protein VirD4